MLHLLYSQLARARRRYYQQRPYLRRRLSAPVISVGNLTVGGSGKTPLVAEIARILLAMGERPAILSRGYARRILNDGVVVVCDGRRILSDVEHSGDEPFMLARQVPEASVLVCSSRYLAGRLAESRLGATVHVLDDGFQHFELMRDVDLLIAPDEGEDTRTLPSGRFREPMDAASAADALMIDAAAHHAAVANRAEALSHHGAVVAQDFSPVLQSPNRAEPLSHHGAAVAQDFSPVLQSPNRAEALSHHGAVVAQDFSPVLQSSNRAEALCHQPLSFEFTRRLAGPAPDGPAFAFAGIARPDRFYRDLEAAGWQLTGRQSFRDHHHYSRRDLDAIADAARQSGARTILTTEKDAVRLPGQTGLPIVAVPLETSIEPRFGEWIAERLRGARSA